MATPSEASFVPRRRARACRWLIAAGAAVALPLATSADDNMRCRNGRLINTGMSTAEVNARCGQPQSRTVEDIPIRARLPTGAVVQTGTTRGERWIYERGQGQFDAQLTFEDDKLIRIDFLTRP